MKYKVEWALKSAVTYVNSEIVSSRFGFYKENLISGEFYKFRVQSNNKAGWSLWSKEVEIETARAPDAPINLLINAGDSSGEIFELQWIKGSSDGDSPVIDYNIYMDDGS